MRSLQIKLRAPVAIKYLWLAAAPVLSLRVHATAAGLTSLF